MSTAPDGREDGGADDPIRHPTERERAIRAAVLGVALGVLLRLVSGRRSA